jgi:acetylornithine/succinyldiaminopimelate/putrescine aminotransferase
VRGAGLLLGLVVEDGLPAKALRDALLAQGVLTGTCNDPQVLRLCPPLTLTVAQAESFLAALDAAAASLPARS